MPASALLKFVQGATVGGDGRALVGVLTTSVALSNVNNTSVASWQIDLVYVDPTSGLSIATPYAFNDASSTPAAAFAPDVRRSYRWQLKVWSVPNRVGEPDDIDIRVFSVRELNGALIPPSQVWPPPLPDTRSGELNAKPNEMNFAGQLEGWHGTGSDGLLNELLALHLPPLPGSPGDVLTVSGGRWVSAPPSGGGGSGDVVGPGVSVTGNVAVYADTTGKLLADGGIALSAFIRHNGSVAFTGNQSMGGFKLTTVANGVAAGDAVNLGQLQAAIAGLDPKGNVRAYTTTNIAALTGLGALTGSGVASFTDGQRVGLGGQSTATQNGIWVVHAGAWTRPTDFNTGMDVSGAYFSVEEGTFADRAFLVQNDEGSAVVGTNNLTLIDFGTSSIAAGNGLQKVGNVISVLHDGATLSSSGSGLKVATGGITTTEIGAGAVNLTTQVTGLLPFANFADGSATSVLGRAAGTVGVMASIASSADGQVMRRTAGVLAFGAVDLADTDAVTGLLALANLTGGSAVGQVLRNTGGNVPAWGALDLADPDAITGLLPFANITSLAALSVLGRGANTLGVMAAITGTADQVLAVNTGGTALAFGQVQTGGIATSAVTLAKLANATASSVLGRSAATVGAYADIASSADGQVLRRGAAGVIAFGAVDLADTDAVTGLLSFANIASGSATSVFGRSANSVGVQASITATVDGHVLQRVAGALTFAALGVGTLGGGSAVGQVLINAVGNVPTWGAVDLADIDAVTGLLPFANIADGAANSVFGRAAGTIGVQASIAASADGQTLRMAAGVVGFGALDLADVDAVTGLLPFANIASLTGLSVLGRSGSTLGVLAAITGTADQVLAVNTAGTALAFGQVQTGGIATSAVTLAKLANATASSVLGRSVATTGAYADIASSADGQVLRRGAAGVIAFGAVDLADTDAVTGLLPFANMASLTGLSVLGRSASTLGVMAAITGTANQVLVVNAGGTALTFGTVSTAGLAANSVDMTILADLAALSVIGRAANTSGDPAAITASATGQILRYAGTTLAFGALDLADADAVTNQLPGSFVVPNFVAQDIITTGTLSLGATPATSGDIKLRSLATVQFRNAANSANVLGLSIGSSDEVRVGNVGGVGYQQSATLHDWRFGGSIVMSLSSTLLAVAAGAINIGTNPAAAGALRLANAAELRARNAANSADIILVSSNASDQAIYGDTTTGQIFLAAQNVLLRPAGTDRVQVTDTVFEWRLATVRFDVAVTNPTINQEVDATNAVTGDTLTIAAQDVTGTGATIGGILALRAGNSTNGTGGGVDIRSGTGLTSILAGNWQARIGSTLIMNWAGADPVASTGTLRLPITGSVISRNQANSADIWLLYTNSGNGVFVGDVATAVSLSLQTTGARLILGTNVEIQNSSQLQFDSAVATPVITQESTTTAAATGQLMVIEAQGVTGTGSTVGGALFVRGGISINGTGGALNLRSGAGATAILAGAVQIAIGGTAIFDYPGTVIPATTGILRAYHNSSVLAGRDSGNTTNAALVRWGVTATNKATFGNTVYATEVLGSTVEIGDGSVYLEVAVLATNREILSVLLGSAITTTQMPANTGDKVGFWADATALPTTGLPVGGTILHSSSTMGFGGKSTGGVESTLVPLGDTTAATRKLADLKVVDTITTAATTEVSVVTVDTNSANFNGAAFSGILKVKFECIGFQTAGNFYSHGLEVVALITVSGGTATIIDNVKASNSGTGGVIDGQNPPTVFTIKVSGSVIQGRVAPFDASAATWFGKLTIMGFST